MDKKSVEQFNKRILRKVIKERQIKRAVKKLGAKIDALYDGKPILLVSVLKGGAVFLTDVLRAVTVPCEIAFMRAKSYSGTTSSGEVEILLDIEQDVTKYNVVILEDIVDTGRTLSKIVEIIKERKPLTLTVVAFLDKPSRRVVDFKPDISLFTVPDFFAVGYGLDCDEYYRNLPYVAEYGEKE